MVASKRARIAASVLSAVALAAAAALTAALAWGVWRSDDGETPHDAAIQQAPIDTGNAAIDELLLLLQQHDVDGLIERVQLLPEPCTPSDERFGRLPCPEGVAVGTDVPGFAIGGCELTYAASPDEAREWFQYVLGARSDRSSIFAIGRQALGKHRDPYDVVVLTPGRRPLAGEPASLWYVTPAGKIVRLETECVPYGGAQVIEARGLGAGGLLPPQVSCAPDPVAITFVVIAVHRDFGPQIVGEIVDQEGVIVGERVIVTAFARDGLGFQVGRTPPAEVARLPSAYDRIEDIAPGTHLRVEGVLRSNCTIDASRLTLI